jgi:hypothetical protein
MPVDETVVAAIMFVCLLAASLGGLWIYPKIHALHRDEPTLNVVRMVANIFVMMTSLVLGLMITSAKSTLELVDRNMHALAADVIVLDRSFQYYGPAADGARQRLLAWAQQAQGAINNERLTSKQREEEKLLGDVAASLKALNPQDESQRAEWRSAQQQLLRLMELRWLILGQARGTIPGAVVVMLIAWLMLVFASYALRAPRNGVVVATFLGASLLLSGAVYLTLDMDRPLTGPVCVSAEPLQRAVDEMQR